MRRAFSMLELVVVMAILAVIAAVVFPVFGQALKKAHETGCVSNVHQVDLAAELYRQDQGEYPVVMVDNPVFLPYFSGKAPVCPAAQNSSLSYLVIAGIQEDQESMDDPAKRAYVDALRSCREKRGPDFPVVMDQNHITKVEGYRSGEPFFIFARVSGAVQRVPSKQWDEMLNGARPLPCDSQLYYGNL